MYKIDPKMKPFFDLADRLKNNDHTFENIFNIGSSFRPNNNIFIYIDNGKRKTIKYKEYKTEVYKYAQAIDTLLNNIEKGSFVALKMTNSPMWAYVFWGLIISGYKPLMINPITLRKDTERLLSETGAKAIFTEEDNEYSVKLVKPSCIKPVSPIEKVSWENEIAFCTSGTTGNSRVFVYTAENIFNQIYAAWIMPKTTKDIMYDKDLRLISIIPFSHIFGFVAIFLWYTFFGRTIVFPKSNSPEDLVSCCIKENISHIYAVPLFWNRVAKSFNDTINKENESKKSLVKKMIDYNNKKITRVEAGKSSWKFVHKVVKGKILGSNVRYCISGGSALPKDTLETINGLGYPLYNGYGMTEIGITSVELSPDVIQRNKGSIGQPLTAVEYKIENNELLVKSPQIHSFTVQNGTKMKANIDNEGYFHTGDIAECIEGNYYIRGKAKDVIIGPNGENIYPDEIETKFKNIGFVSNFAVVGVPSKDGDKVTMILEIQQKLTKQQIDQLENEISDINSSLPIAMQIQEFLLSTTPLPINPSMKVMKYQLVDDLKNRPETFIRLNSSSSVSFDGFSDEEIKNVSDHVKEIFCDILNLDPSNVSLDGHFMIDLGGDSFTYMSIVASVESEFEIKIPTEMIGRLNSINDFSLYILRNKN